MTSDDSQLGQCGQTVEQCCPEAVGEVVQFAFASDIDEGQHGNRGDRPAGRFVVAPRLEAEGAEASKDGDGCGRQP